MSVKSTPTYLKIIITLLLCVFNGLFIQNLNAQNTPEENIEMPRLSGCENEVKIEACAKEKLLRYVYSNLNYPRKARNRKIDGTVQLSFVVDKLGEIKDFKIISSPDPSMDKECIKVLEKMKKDKLQWIPGKKNGEAVDMIFEMPMKFVLVG